MVIMPGRLRRGIASRLPVLDSVLAERRLVAGRASTIAGIAHLGWVWWREFGGGDFTNSLNVDR